MAQDSKPGQVPTGEGVQDLPSVPGSLAKQNTPALQSIGEVQDKSSPSKGSSS